MTTQSFDADPVIVLGGQDWDEIVTAAKAT